MHLYGQWEYPEEWEKYFKSKKKNNQDQIFGTGKVLSSSGIRLHRVSGILPSSIWCCRFLGRGCWTLQPSVHSAMSVLVLTATQCYICGRIYGENVKIPLRPSDFLGSLSDMNREKPGVGNWQLASAQGSIEIRGPECTGPAEWSCSASHLGWYIETNVDLVFKAVLLPNILTLVGRIHLSCVCHDFCSEFFSWSPA